MKTLNILFFLLIFNTFILLGFLVSEFTGKVTYQTITVNITKIVDGDTLDTEIGRIRLLGINTPEKSQPYYREAKENLARYEGKQIELESHGKDRYQRTLAYIFYNNKLINKEQLELGLSNLYYYGEDDYYQEMKKAEETARKQGIGIWKKSTNSGCLDLVRLQYQEGEKRCTNNEKLIISNKCQEMSTIIKDDANHITEIKIPAGIFSMNFSCIWNDDGDTLTIRDEEGLLLWHRY